MKTLINKISKNFILPLAIAGGIYNAGFSQTATDSLEENYTNVQAIDFNKDKKIDYILFKYNLTENGYYEIRLADRNYDGRFESKTASLLDKKGNTKEIENNIINSFIDSQPIKGWIKEINELGEGAYNINLTGKIGKGF